jgi:hypothetical protein
MGTPLLASDVLNVIIDASMDGNECNFNLSAHILSLFEMWPEFERLYRISPDYDPIEEAELTFAQDVHLIMSDFAAVDQIVIATHALAAYAYRFPLSVEFALVRTLPDTFIQLYCIHRETEREGIEMNNATRRLATRDVILSWSFLFRTYALLTFSMCENSEFLAVQLRMWNRRLELIALHRDRPNRLPYYVTHPEWR